MLPFPCSCRPAALQAAAAASSVPLPLPHRDGGIVAVAGVALTVGNGVAGGQAGARLGEK